MYPSIRNLQKGSLSARSMRTGLADKPTRKKLICASVAAISCAFSLSGCSSEDSQSSSSASTEPVRITYMNFTSNGGNEENLEKIITAFEAENENITVDVTTLPYADYFTTLQTDLAGGTVADVFDIEYANYAAYQESGVLAPLEGVDMAVYQDSLAQSYSTDGTPYALPTSFSNVVLFYNKDLFDKAGLEYPTADWTWEDEQAAALAITDSENGIWGDYQPISYNEFYKVLEQTGGKLLNSDGTKVAFNSAEGKRAAEWLINPAPPCPLQSKVPAPQILMLTYSLKEN